MANKTSMEGPNNDVQWAEIQGLSRASWMQLSRRKQEAVLQLRFVKRLFGPQIFFDRAYSESQVAGPLRETIEKLIGSSEISFFATDSLKAQRAAEHLEADIRNPSKFKGLSWGSDVAERDAGLLQYFISTKAFERAKSGEATIIIGPKGSGKTAILKALLSDHGSNNTVTISPEVFATSMLRQAVESNKGLWEEDQAFTSTWVFTILVEVFKRLANNPKGVPNNSLKKLRVFLRDNADYQELDIFSRFIGYLKKIEGVKVGEYEFAVKTRKLQELYSLANLYEIVPLLRGVEGEVLILLDELDQGWDNTTHTNEFIGSLLQAATKIQSLGLKVRVIAFLRSEIFDLIKGRLAHLDKLRTSIEVINWSEGELAALIVRRVAHSLNFSGQVNDHELTLASTLFDGSFRGMSGFSYLLSRTSLRPREVLQFLSHTHRTAVGLGHSTILPETLFKAEEEFSSWKLDHICSEYKDIYPRLRDVLEAFRGEGPILSKSDITDVMARYMEMYEDDCPSWAKGTANEILPILYTVDFIGVPRRIPTKNKIGIEAQFEFAYERRVSNIKSVESFLIHPMYWSALEVPRE